MSWSLIEISLVASRRSIYCTALTHSGKTFYAMLMTLLVIQDTSQAEVLERGSPANAEAGVHWKLGVERTRRATDISTHIITPSIPWRGIGSAQRARLTLRRSNRPSVRKARRTDKAVLQISYP